MKGELDNIFSRMVTYVLGAEEAPKYSMHSFPVPGSQTWSDLVRLAPQTLQRPAGVSPSVRE